MPTRQQRPAGGSALKTPPRRRPARRSRDPDRERDRRVRRDPRDHRLGVDVQRRLAPGPDRAAGVELGRGLQGVRGRDRWGWPTRLLLVLGRGAAAEGSYTPVPGISKVRRAAARRVLASRRAGRAGPRDTSRSRSGRAGRGWRSSARGSCGSRARGVSARPIRKSARAIFSRQSRRHSSASGGSIHERCQRRFLDAEAVEVVPAGPVGRSARGVAGAVVEQRLVEVDDLADQRRAEAVREVVEDRDRRLRAEDVPDLAVPGSEAPTMVPWSADDLGAASGGRGRGRRRRPRGGHPSRPSAGRCGSPWRADRSRAWPRPCARRSASDTTFSMCGTMPRFFGAVEDHPVRPGIGRGLRWMISSGR